MPLVDELDGRATLDRFRRMVMADGALQRELAQVLEPALFAELAVARAAERGLVLAARDVAQAVWPDPLGLRRWRPDAASQRDWPGRGWLPAHISGPQTPTVEWACFGDEALTDPFFEGSVRRALVRPFNRLFGAGSRLDDFLVAAAAHPARAPDGLIFHMSRCGSTLVSQMMRAIPGAVVVSEAQPVDVAVQIEAGPLAETYPGVLAAVAAALGRSGDADGPHGPYVLKLDSWHALALPVFRRVFPDTPWVFLYRDPLEVMVSQARMRGMQTIPGAMAPQVFGLDPQTTPDGEYCARVLSMTCEAALAHHGLGGGRLVNYAELPEAVFTRILPHFGLAGDAATRAAMSAAAGRNAKAPDLAFTSDSEAKRGEVTPDLAALSARWLAEPYRRLEALRAGRP